MWLHYSLLYMVLIRSQLCIFAPLYVISYLYQTSFRIWCVWVYVSVFSYCPVWSSLSFLDLSVFFISFQIVLLSSPSLSILCFVLFCLHLFPVLLPLGFQKFLLDSCQRLSHNLWILCSTFPPFFSHVSVWINSLGLLLSSMILSLALLNILMNPLKVFICYCVISIFNISLWLFFSIFHLSTHILHLFIHIFH